MYKISTDENQFVCHILLSNKFFKQSNSSSSLMRTKSHTSSFACHSLLLMFFLTEVALNLSLQQSFPSKKSYKSLESFSTRAQPHIILSQYSSVSLV